MAPKTEYPGFTYHVPIPSCPLFLEWTMFFSQDVVKDRWLEVQLLSDEHEDMLTRLDSTSIATQTKRFRRADYFMLPLQMTVVSGILDVVTFINYRVFTTKQTGNVLFLAVYVAGKKHLRSKIESNVVISIVSFCVGSFAFARLAHQARARKCSWLLFTTSVQVILMLAAFFLQVLNTSNESASLLALAIVALLSFAASGQTSLAVTVGLAELNTAMVTGALVSVLNDPKVLIGSNPVRTRRLWFIASYAAGCLIGAAMNLEAAGTLFLAFVIKLSISASFLFNRGQAVGRFQEETGPEEEAHAMVSPVVKSLRGD
ncbi:hypothetical protein Q7P37_004168 [Cladosporium fusiforme]